MKGSMARLVLKDNITFRGALAPGQTVWLGGFTMITRSGFEPTMTTRAIENALRINSEYSKQMDLVEFSSLYELLYRIAALGIVIDYDQIGPKTDQGETETPPVTPPDSGSLGAGWRVFFYIEDKLCSDCRS